MGQAVAAPPEPDLVSLEQQHLQSEDSSTIVLLQVSSVISLVTICIVCKSLGSHFAGCGWPSPDPRAGHYVQTA